MQRILIIIIGQGHIKDNAAQKLAVDTYSYNITSSTVDNNGNITGVNEGSDVIFTITRTREDGQNIGSNDKPSTVYVSTAEGTAYEEDYVGLNLKAITFKKTETKLEIPVSTKKDSVAESGDDEFFYFDLFETKADAENYNYSAYSMGHIKDVADNTASAAAYEYEVNKGAKFTSSDAVKEGGDIVFTITRDPKGGSADSASTIYYSTSAGTASSDDFEVVTAKAIEFKPGELTKKISVGTKKDAEADDGEYFWFDIFKTISDAENFVYYEYDKGYIEDDVSSASGFNNYTYEITNTNTSGQGVKEGQSTTFTITRTKQSGNNAEATVYVATSEGTADTDDFDSISLMPITFSKDALVKTVTVQTNLDGENDDNEFFTLDLFKSEADWEDGNYETFGEAYIANNGDAATAYSAYKYTVTVDSSTNGGGSSSPAKEGDEITFTIGRERVDGQTIGNSDVKSTVFLSTTHATTDDEDIVSLNNKVLEFGKKETSKKVTVKTYTDNEITSIESFY